MVSNQSLNKVWLIILIIAGVLFISYYFFGYDIIGKTKSIPSNIGGEIKKSTTLNNDYCKTNIILDKIVVAKTFDSKYESIYPSDLRSDNWKDETKIEYDNIGLVPLCKKGSKQGENVNNFYCKSLLYSNSLINNEGVLGKEVSYKIDLILSGDYKDEEPFETMFGEKTNVVSFEVIDYTCHKI